VKTKRRCNVLLTNKTAVIYGAGGAIGGAVAREGASVFLAGRTLATVDAVAKDIAAAGGRAETAQVDALDEQVVEQYTGAVAAKAGGSTSASTLSASPSRACRESR
jgi:3-oxoacyl-[acyl-carrier protein] reductase